MFPTFNVDYPRDDCCCDIFGVSLAKGMHDRLMVVFQLLDNFCRIILCYLIFAISVTDCLLFYSTQP